MSVPRRITYFAKRRADWQRQGTAWDKLAAKDLVSELDEPNSMPEMSVEDRSLTPGLACLYVGDRAHGEAFCRRAIAVADRIVAEDKCRANEVCEAGYPENLGVVLRGRAYARWLLGEPLERAELRRVAEHMVEWCLTKAMDRGRFTDSITMCHYLEGVRAAMVACDLDYASDLLKTKQPFLWHHAVERDLWARLVGAYPDVGPELREEVEEFFDRIRDPDFDEVIATDSQGRKVHTFINREILAMETGIIREMYLASDSALEPVDPVRVLREVAR
jgi:hypothetical protein